MTFKASNKQKQNKKFKFKKHSFAQNLRRKSLQTYKQRWRHRTRNNWASSLKYVLILLNKGLYITLITLLRHKNSKMQTNFLSKYLLNIVFMLF